MSFGFLTPALLFSLLALPALYLLIRLLPPRPKEQNFPALKLLLGMPDTSPPPRTPPLWLLLLRMAALALLILGLAQPVIRLDGFRLASQPLVLVIDNGWSAAPVWPDIEEQAQLLLEQARARDLPVMLLPTADNVEAVAITPTAALNRLKHIKPRPWPSRIDVLVEKATHEIGVPVTLVWLSDGMQPTAGVAQTLENLGKIGNARVMLPPTRPEPLMITKLTPVAGGLAATLWRADSRADRDLSVSLTDMDGRFMTRRGGIFASGETHTTLTLELPGRLQSAGIARIDGQNHLGAWYGVSSVSGLPRVGLMADDGNNFPLLEGGFYLSNALADTVKVERIAAHTPPQDIDVLLLARMPTDVSSIERWVETGGTLITFAGPWLEENRQLDTLLPVRLRTFARSLSGPLSWTGALGVGSANPQGPLKDIRAQDDIKITTQFLPEESPELTDKIWLSLADGTPLISGDKHGNGWRVLVHVTADARWSSLPLSGTFVDILQTLLELGRNQQSADSTPFPLQPLKIFDANGQAVGRGSAAPLADAETPVSIRNPVGFYGPAGHPYPHHLPTFERERGLLEIDVLGGLSVQYYGHAGGQISLQPPLLALALMLLLLDGLFRVWGWRLFPQLGRASVTVFVLLFSTQAMANEFPPAAYEMRLAYIPSGDAELDAITESGLRTLSETLDMRTTVEPGDPVRLKPETDTLGFYPVIFWPVATSLHVNEQTGANLRAHMERGGVIVIDGLTRRGENPLIVKRILNRLLGVTLKPLDGEHVLNRAYYLLHNRTPGRVVGNGLWLENTAGVSNVIVGSHDWVGAWARTPRGGYVNTVTPGGENQRDISLRFGVNLIMYALLGDYKADQMHIDTLLERMERNR